MIDQSPDKAIPAFEKYSHSPQSFSAASYAERFFTLTPPARITVFIGAYGSGKSEIAVNYALALKAVGHPVVLADLDIINPFYRSADAESILTQAGIELIKPIFANTNVDVPAVPGAVFSLFDRTDRFAILDIGGEDLGARILASLKNRFPDEQSAEQAHVYFVVNTCRPFTSDPEQIAVMADSLTGASNMRITGMINNTNLLEFSDEHVLLESEDVIQTASDRTAIPVAFAAARDDLVPAEWGSVTPDGRPLLRMTRTIFYPTD